MVFKTSFIFSVFVFIIFAVPVLDASASMENDPSDFIRLTPSSFIQGTSTINLGGNFRATSWTPACAFSPTYGLFPRYISNLRYVILETNSGLPVQSEVALSYGSDYEQIYFGTTLLDCPTNFGNDPGKGTNPEAYGFVVNTYRFNNVQIPVSTLPPGDYTLAFSSDESIESTFLPCVDVDITGETDETGPVGPWAPGECDSAVLTNDLYPDIAFSVTAPLPATVEVVTNNSNATWNGAGPAPQAANNFSGSGTSGGPYLNRTPGTYDLSNYDKNCFSESVETTIDGGSSQNGNSRDVGSGETLRFTITYTDDGSCSAGSDPFVDITFNGSDGPVGINSGDSGTLFWTVADADSCTRSWSSSTSPSSGSQVMGPLTAGITYTINCVNANGSASDSVTVTINGLPAPPSVSLTINGSAGPLVVPTGFSSNDVDWAVSDADSCTASNTLNNPQWSGTKSSSGGNNGSTGIVNSDTTFTLSCSGPGGTNSDNVFVDIQSAGEVCNVTANPDAGTPPLNNVDADIVGADFASRYYVDCTNDGTWEYISGILVGAQAENHNVSDVCDYSSSGNYTMNVRRELIGQDTSVYCTDSVNVAATGTISASPNPCVFSGAATTCTSLFSWNTVGAPGACVFVRETSTLFGCAANINNYAANWINSTGYNFDLRETNNVTSPLIDTIFVSGINGPPAISDVTLTEPNYCTSGPGGTVSWTIDSGGPQEWYQVQVDTNAAFNSPDFDSSQVNSISTSYAIPNGALLYNVNNYRVRVQIGASGGTSNWVSMSSCSGPGCSGPGNSWDTPGYAYPDVDFTYSPPVPTLGNPVQFTDATVFNGPASNRNWDWNFNNAPFNPVPPIPPDSVTQNPTAVFGAGDYIISLMATDNAGQSCSITTPLNVKKIVPIWKEVLPR